MNGSHLLLTRLLAATAVAWLLSPFTFAQTVWVVDSAPGPGVHFTDVQSAVDVAGPLDRVDVRPGSYSTVTIDKPLTLMGTAASGVTMVALRIENLQAQEQLVLADFEVSTAMDIDNCSGTVICDGLKTLSTVRVADSTDVRLQSMEMRKRTVGQIILQTSDSFVQIVSSSIIGPLSALTGLQGYGATALVVRRGSDLVLTDCVVQGGDGESAGLFGNDAGPGGNGISFLGTGQSSLLLVDCIVRHGLGGVGNQGQAPPGNAVVGCAPQTSITRCRTTVIGATPSCTGTIMTDITRPALTLAGGSLPAQVVTVEVNAPPTASTRLYAGRTAALVPILGSDLPLMHSAERGVYLGFTSATGMQTLAFTIPALQRGTTLHFQTSRVFGPGGGTEWSNAAALIVR